MGLTGGGDAEEAAHYDRVSEEENQRRQREEEIADDEEPYLIDRDKNWSIQGYKDAEKLFQDKGMIILFVQDINEWMDGVNDFFSRKQIDLKKISKEQYGKDFRKMKNAIIDTSKLMGKKF